jgi:putative transposase
MIQINRKVVESKTINQSLGILLCSYARAVNIQEGRKGSLFQQHTKAICLNENLEISQAWYKIFGTTKINKVNEIHEYPNVCMNYIHQNPVRAGLVFNVKSWRWSSYHQIHLNDNDIELVNMEVLKNVVRL